MFLIWHLQLSVLIWDFPLQYQYTYRQIVLLLNWWLHSLEYQEDDHIMPEQDFLCFVGYQRLLIRSLGVPPQDFLVQL